MRRYEAEFRSIEVWTKHKREYAYPPRMHSFWSDQPTTVLAIAEYVEKRREERTLGDGSPCIISLHQTTPNHGPTI